VQAGKTVGSIVLSAAIRGEWNVLLNPAHADFLKITLQEPRAFEFDVRMFP
jgi:RES domain-containing protein